MIINNEERKPKKMKIWKWNGQCGESVLMWRKLMWRSNEISFSSNKTVIPIMAFYWWYCRNESNVNEEMMKIMQCDMM